MRAGVSAAGNAPCPFAGTVARVAERGVWLDAHVSWLAAPVKIALLFEPSGPTTRVTWVERQHYSGVVERWLGILTTRSAPAEIEAALDRLAQLVAASDA